MAENWAAYLHDKWQPQGTRFAQVYPRWKDGTIDGPIEPRVANVYQSLVHFLEAMDTFLYVYDNARLVVRNLFICRSPQWVPPHHDKNLLKMMQQIIRRNPGASVTYGEVMHKRSAPTRAEANKARKIQQQQYEEMMAELNKRGQDGTAGSS